MNTFVKLILVLILPVFMLLTACTNKPTSAKDFRFFLNEKTMILNKEGNNEIEGTYLRVDSGGGTALIKINAMPQSVNSHKDLSHWMLGWGKQIPYYDAGSENLREIVNYDSIKRIFQLGKLLRGEGYPVDHQPLVFWNRTPSGFRKYKSEPIIDENKGWKEFSGRSFSFSKIIQDSLNGRWIMYLNEVDADSLRVYAAESKDLYEWNPLNNSQPLFSSSQFKNISWTGNNADPKAMQALSISDVLFYKGMWHFILDGYDKQGKCHIGKITAIDPVKGPFVIDPTPILNPGSPGEWDEKKCFFGKVVFDGKRFLMYYVGFDNQSNGSLGLALSDDLEHWEKYKGNPVINDRRGWRSKFNSTEPVYVQKMGDKIYLLLCGTKAFRNDFIQHYIKRRTGMDRSGNVNDIELGAYLSEDGGYTFNAHLNNPVFINDFSDLWENDHLGCNFELIKKNNTLFLFYQAKTDAKGMVYKPFLRIKSLNAQR